MDIINCERKTSIIMGNFNIDLLKYGIHRKTNDCLDNVFSRGFVSLIYIPIRLISSTVTLIDHIYTNKQKPKFSSEHDDISTKLLKETINLIHQPITHIINHSFIIGVVLTQLKIAKVNP